MNALTINPSNPLVVPDYLLGINTGVTEAMLAAVSLGGSRIGFKGSRFRIVVNGKEEGIIQENYLDVIVLAAFPAVSRIYYEAAYNADVAAAPTCYAADGIAPPADVKAKQSDKCATCPQNVTGSKIVNNNKMKACGYFRRLVVMLPGDPDQRAFRVDVKSKGIFGESHVNVHQYSLNDYIKFVGARNVDVGTIVTRLTFDTDESVPKLLFSPSRYVTQEELAIVRARVVADDVKQMVDVNMTTVDLSSEVAQEAPVTQVPTPVQQTVQAAPPVQQTAPQVIKATPQVLQPVQQVLKPTQVAKPAPQQTVQQAVAPQVMQQPQQVVRTNIPPPAAVAVAVQEVGTDAELEALLAALDS